jgi:hypothetical protein
LGDSVKNWQTSDKERDRPNLETENSQRPRPVLRFVASIHCHNTRRLTGEELCDGMTVKDVSGKK